MSDDLLPRLSYCSLCGRFTKVFCSSRTTWNESGLWADTIGTVRVSISRLAIFNAKILMKTFLHRKYTVDIHRINIFLNKI